MYFVKRGDRYIDVAGKSFRDFFAGKLARSAGRAADHFRLGQPPEHDFSRRCGSSAIWRCAAPTAGRGGGCRRSPAFWVGLLYDDDALDACWDMVKDWTAEERQKLRDDVPRLGFKAEIRGRNVLDAGAGDAAARSHGLGAPQTARPQRPRRDALSAPARGIVARGITPAEELLEKFHGAWNGSVEPIFDEYAYCDCHPARRSS